MHLYCHGSVVWAPKLVLSIVLASTAKKVWDEFKERFHKSNLTRVYQLWREIATHTQGTDSITVYYSKLKDFWDDRICWYLILLCKSVQDQICMCPI